MTAPGAADIIYQHSVLGRPLPIRRQVRGSGWTCTLRISSASRIFISRGNGPENFLSPVISLGYFSMAEASVCPASSPFAITDLSSGKSASSQLSPILAPAGMSLLKTSRSFRPPQIRSLYSGLNFNGDILIRGILTTQEGVFHAAELFFVGG